MRIVYGVFGYGRGHATRALSVAPALRERHEVLLLAGGDAFDALAHWTDVVRIPTLRYAYAASGTRSLSRTLGENARHVGDILFAGAAYREVERRVRDFRPDVAICDAEPWTHAVASRLEIPRVSFDHFGILAYCRPSIPWHDRLRSLRDVLAYRALMGRPDRVIVSSFYRGTRSDPGVRFVGPILRPEVLARRPVPGGHLLVYLNKGKWQLTPRIEAALQALGRDVLVYGTERRGSEGRLCFRAPSNEGFLDDLAGCDAVLSTAGNQLVGEAAWLGKPLLVTPENTVEQRLNAASVERLGIGRQVSHAALDAAVLRRFLSDRHSFHAPLRAIARDGRQEALAAIERFAHELRAARPAVARRSAWEPA